MSKTFSGDLLERLDTSVSALKKIILENDIQLSSLSDDQISKMDCDIKEIAKSIRRYDLNIVGVTI